MNLSRRLTKSAVKLSQVQHTEMIYCKMALLKSICHPAISSYIRKSNFDNVCDENYD